MVALVAFVIFIFVPIFPASDAAFGLVTNGPLQEVVLELVVGFNTVKGVSVVNGERDKGVSVVEGETGKGVGLVKAVGLGIGVSIGTEVDGIAACVCAYIVFATARAEA